jgi:predicted lipid-binding transport protein (Tim44 family)
MTPSRGKWHKWFTGASAVVVVLLGFALVAQDAEARRLGAGQSFGRQSQNVTRQQSAPTQSPTQGTAANPSLPPTAPQPAGNRWLGPLAGLAAGVGLGALLSHFGMGADAGGLVMLALLLFGAFALWRMFAARSIGTTERDRPPVFNQAPTRPALETMGSSAMTNVYGSPLLGTHEPAAAAAATWNVPADFDMPGFLRSAKVNFTRLQAAWDAKDFEDIRRFTTPEVFAEIKMQNDESAGKTDRTDIDQLDATLLGIETTAAEYLASVRFTGTLRENGGSPEPIEEVWNLAKPIDGNSGWLLAGIQQVH